MPYWGGNIEHNLQKPGPWLILALQGTKRSDITQFERNRRGRQK